MAYVSGNPILTDKEFDELKMRLKVCLNYLPFYICLAYLIAILS